MKKCFIAIFMVVFWSALIYLSACLTSCTATLRADKLWYNGTLVRPSQAVLMPDSL